MVIVNIHEAKTNLSKLVAGAVQGESFVIAKAGQPLVRVTAIEPTPGPRRVGFLVGQFEVPDDFDTLAAREIEAVFEGGPEDEGASQ